MPLLRFWVSLIAGPETRFAVRIFCRHFGLLQVATFLNDYIANDNVFLFTRAKVLHVDGALHFHTSSVLKSLVIPTISFAMAVDIRDVFMYQGAPVNQIKMNAFLESVVEIMNAG